MESSTKRTSPEKLASPCIVVGISEGGKLSPAADAVDRASGGAVRGVLRAGDISGKAGTTRLLYALPGVAAKRVLLAGTGKASSAPDFRESVRAAALAAAATGAEQAHFFLAQVPVTGRDAAWRARQLVAVASEALYRFEQLKSKKAEPQRLRRIVVCATDARDMQALERGAKQGQALAAGMNFARDLGNLPANVCTPAYLADRAREMARSWKLGVEVLEKRDMEKLGMGALLSVARGSHQPPKMIVLRHMGGTRKDKPVVLVGKGITFDTGGISLKPAAEMDEMKFDMCGAASVLGTMRAAAELRLPLNLIAIVPTTENMPGGAATKPGDIVTTMSGQTVEILNTDAEGRLILCDAMTYAERFEPKAVIDVATLTGACVIALGNVCSGLYANREPLARELLAAGEDAWDRAWQMPLWDDYQQQLKSNFADFANIGGRAAGSVTAACYLARFAGKYAWAHLDIAGVAWKSGKDKGSTGRPVPLLLSYLLRLSGRK